MIKRIIQYIYTGWCAIAFVVPMLVFALPMVIPIVISRKLDNITYFFIRVWVYIFSLLTGIWFIGHNKKVVDRKKSYIFVINHTSFLDAPAIPIAIPSSLVALGKKELSKIPVFGWITGRFAVWVDRSDTESRKEGSKRLKELLSGGTSVLVAPEGTRNNTDDPLLPFRYGPFRLAIESQIPIIPVIIHDAGKLMKRGSLLLNPGVVHCYCLPEISVEGLTDSDLDQLTQSTYELMKNKIIELDKG
ncbi:lysophospholipid acyltransferase family protein [Roseivirga spongicola]|uniref:lysophospholipid acyltransferase family protein n=1 Tax=Roseivirga spongicola TaxID=333140 RepID=UPI000D7945DC|nr:lysophospholipid acyltransferase family protein [Roseivirga spongicola]PWL29702.1 MAG: 1-acyl-sn-glycerol-3-phosphate acyltransferase [Roseivirga sp. XM-24bin3]WPZ11599.1 lysophospholipid acyltransferase family protein [Roseivirga spongicola]